MTSNHRLFAVVCALALPTVVACASAEQNDDDRRDDDDDDDDGAEGEGEGEGLPVTAGAWTYTEVEGAACGNGSPVGVAVNAGTSSRLVIYLEGGGACWEQLTCDNDFATYVKTGIPDTVKTQIVNNIGGPFNRSSSTNPFATDSYAYIPYCTGDLHAGTQASNSYGVQHVGGTNFATMLPLILDTFPDVEEVVLAGTSAGGYGAMFNAERVRAALPSSVSLSVIMDSAIPLAPFPGGESIQSQQLAAWQPAVCDGCAGVDAVFEHALDTLSSTTFGMTMSRADSTLRQFFTTNGFSPVAAADWGAAVDAFVVAHADAPNFASFIEDSQRHVFIYESFDTSVGDVTLAEFYAGVVGDGPLVSAAP